MEAVFSRMFFNCSSESVAAGELPPITAVPFSSVMVAPGAGVVT